MSHLILGFEIILISHIGRFFIMVESRCWGIVFHMPQEIKLRGYSKNICCICKAVFIFNSFLLHFLRVNKCHLFFFLLLSIYCVLVPAQVTDLHVANQGTTSSLFTSWTQALGYIEFYQVLLIHENVVIKNESVSSETSRYSFHSLKSGSLYSVVVTTVSGGISSRQVVVEGRTGK